MSGAAKSTSIDGSSGPQKTEIVEILGDDHTASDDLIVHTVGDETGLHLLMARERDGYAWTTVATFSEPGVETDRWIGNACLTSDSRYAAVVYAARAVSNDPAGMQRGGFSALVNINTGAVRKLDFGSSLAHYNPGCGAGGAVVFSSYAGLDDEQAQVRTRLEVVDSADGTTETSTVSGQLASVVPSAQGIVAVRGSSIGEVRGSTFSKLIDTPAPAHRLAVSGPNSVDYVVRSRSRAIAKRLFHSDEVSQSTLATAPLTDLELSAQTGGKAIVTREGAEPSRGRSTISVKTADTMAISTLGHAALSQRRTPSPHVAGGAGTVNPAWEREMTLPSTPQGMARDVHLTLEITSNGRTLESRVRPGQGLLDTAGTGREPSPGTPDGQQRTAAVSTSSSGTIDQDATCAVPRNDPRTQVYQPTPRQVEWAANQAVTGNLNVSRAANWKQAGMSSGWSPQGLFPRRPLAGGGRVPTQVLLGILAQESNLWQASGHSLPGVPGNPLIGNYYGTQVYDGDPSNDFDIRWAHADCGYGIAQVTDGMRKGDSRGAFEQRAIALDYATNIAAGLDILIQKWNQTRAAGLIHDDGDPAKLENWVFAIWAYNSGFYEDKSDGQPWGVGWVNNPANSIWDASRTPFMKNANDAAHPGDWPYQEKVMGFAAYSIATADGPGFRAAWWVNETYRDKAKPPIYTFCDAAINDCDPARDFGPTGHCGHRDGNGNFDYKCWWNRPAAYQQCRLNHCGNELLRFNSTFPEQPDGAYRPPACSTQGLPANALVVDNVPASVNPISTSTRPCGAVGSSAGHFTLQVSEQSPGRAAARIELHQSGAGYGGHVWWSRTRAEPRYGLDLEITGRWAFSSDLNQWARVLVHMPNYGAHTQQAAYVIDDGAGTKIKRHALQRVGSNGWVSLGVIRARGKPSVTLSSSTVDGAGSDAIAWDAVALQPLDQKPRHFVVALGDSFTSGEGASGSRDGDNGADYFKETDFGGTLADDAGRNACHRSRQSWPRKTSLGDSSRAVGERADGWDPTLDFQFHACSGAQTHNLDPLLTGAPGAGPNPLGRRPEGKYGEMTQIDKGYLDRNTTLVMLSIGGNDARFADILQACITGLSGCQDRSLPGETEPMSVTVPRSINGPVRSAVTRTLRTIIDRAPNARIVLMGYPMLFDESVTCTTGLSPEEVAWMNGVTRDVMRPMMEAVVQVLAAEGTAIVFADPTAAFAHRAHCSSAEQIHGIVNQRFGGTASDKPSATGLQPPSAHSFHPNLQGTSTYAAVVERALERIDQ